MPDAVFTVSRLNNYIRNILERDVILESLLVQGELSNFKAHISGHWYFTLKDENAAVNCVMFRSAAAGVPFSPRNGLSVIIAGRVSLYDKTGVYQVYADQMTPLGKGSLALAFEQLKAKLSAEGLFSAGHKRPLPAYPRCIAVITSPVGAAARDIIQIARRRNPKVEIVIVPALMQGKEAAASIAAAFKAVNAWGGADAVILARGGGSMEDLWPFNEELTARAIYASNIPVISAVGHETDFTIADFTADLRAPTPSAAAELAVPLYEQMENSLYAVRSALNRSIFRALDNKKMFLDRQIKRDIYGRMIKALSDHMINLERLSALNEKALDARAGEEERRLAALSKRLNGLSPMNVLLRGYAVVLDESGRNIASAKELAAGRHVKLKFADGELGANITGEGTYAEEKTNV